MTRSAQVTLDWADGTYPFALKIEQLTELQEKCDAGPWYIQWALESAVMSRAIGSAPPKDLIHPYVTEPLRLGLIGGGMPAVEAMKKVRAYAGPGQLYENMAPAFAVLSAALQGVPEDEPEKSEAGQKKAASRSRAGKSGSRKSLASDAQPD
ncbi:gene transfer agent family protein [Paracoccus sp. DMF-8]|uniref:gene transfer agent family protein n=1 Tax=Paracoccus sp. DMF-8 TaxID=3019445 RepID=UPI0023E88D0B|nr:gene transfer agent family protein [Paracoccus sp. DMF-8]MDF3606339.1 gene transfer agent family protein [Paracoccus sp. DMF-8]